MTITPFRFVLAILLTGLIPLFWFVKVVSDRDVALSVLSVVQAERDALVASAQLSAQMLAERDDIDRIHTQELAHVRTENQDLRRAVDDGAQRLRVKAICSAAVPANPGTGGVADAGTAELAADARSDYFTLRDQLALSRQMLLGLQDHVLRVCR